MTADDLLTLASRSGHIAIDGLGSLGNGALHPFATPSHALAIAALGLAFGQRIPFRLKVPMAGLAAGSAAGLLASGFAPASAVVPAILWSLVLGLATWTTLDLRAPVAALAAAAVAAGFLCGLDSAAESTDPAEAAKFLTGCWLGINAGAGYLGLCVSHSRGRPWARIAIRVAASWILAVALLVLAFSLRNRSAQASPLPQENEKPACTRSAGGLQRC